MPTTPAFGGLGTTRPRSRAATALGAVALGFVAGGCLAPRGADAHEGSLKEFAKAMEEAGAQPVEGTQRTRVDRADELPPSEPLPADDILPLPEPGDVAAEDLEFDDVPYVEENPYLRFGERIQVHELEDGRQIITRPFPMPLGKAKAVLDLMKVLHPFPFSERTLDDVAAQTEPPNPDLVEIVLLPGWDFENYGNLQNYPPTKAPGVEIGDLFIVTATASKLAMAEEFINLFAAGVPQIEIEAKIIEITETDTLDYGVTPIFSGGAAQPTLEFGGANFVKSFTSNLPNSTSPTEALLAIGGIHDGVAFNALIEAVQSWQNVAIESRPKTVVRAGGVARIESTTAFPYYKISGINTNGGFTATVEYKDVGVKLYIAPRVLGSKSLALDVHLEGSQVTGFEDAFVDDQGNSFTIPVIASRTAKTIVYLEPGQTLVIGGLTQERSQKVINKVPILGDIPILGYLFRSTFDQVSREHVLFAISPRIVQRGQLEDF